MENVTIQKTEEFQCVVANEGFYLTSVEDEDIINFTAVKEIYFPLNYDFSKSWKVITEQEYFERCEKRDNQILMNSVNT